MEVTGQFLALAIMLLGIFQSQCDHLEEKKKSFAPVWN
jgi:hypothetical protein